MTSYEQALALRTGQDSADFPMFEDGDVLVILSSKRQYQLHARTLRMHSDLFRRLICESSACKLSSKAKKEGVKIQYRLELKLPSDGAHGAGRFIRRTLDSSGRSQGTFVDMDIINGRIGSNPVYKHYDNIFAAYYYRPVTLSENNIQALVADVVGLVEVAEYLGSHQVIGMPVDNALIQQGQVLWRSISANAAVWSNLALRLRSDMIMKECIIHLVGQWKKYKSHEALDPIVRKICEAKWTEINAQKIEAERLVLGHYPAHIRRPEQPNVGPGGATIPYKGATRTDTYTPQILAWMAMNLYRHWVGQHICSDLARYAEDEGHTFYNAVATGGDAYMDAAAVEGFCEFFPLSKKARRSFDEQIALIKEGVKPYVKELVRNRSQLDVKAFAVNHLTCAKVDKKEMPWFVAAAVQEPEEEEEEADMIDYDAEMNTKRAFSPDEDDEEEEEAEQPAQKKLKPLPKQAGGNFEGAGSGVEVETPKGGLPWEEEDEDEEEEEDEILYGGSSRAVESAVRFEK